MTRERAKNVVEASGLQRVTRANGRRDTMAEVRDDGSVLLRHGTEKVVWGPSELPFDEAVKSIKAAAAMLEVMTQ